MKALLLEELGMDYGSEMTVPGPLWEGPHYPGPKIMQVEPCLSFFPPQLCLKFGREAVCVEDDARRWLR